MKTVVGVPESLTREQYVSLIESVGFEAKHLRSLEFRMDGIYAEVMDLKDGKPHFGVGNDVRLATNRVFIPVKD
jgi:hypothetical protein